MSKFDYFLEGASIAGIVLSGFLDYPYNGIVAAVIGVICLSYISYICVRNRKEKTADGGKDLQKSTDS